MSAEFSAHVRNRCHAAGWHPRGAVLPHGSWRIHAPHEWFTQDRPGEWDAFVARVKAIPYMKGMKRRNYLLQNADEAAERFRARNLNDTRWSCRLLAEALRQVLPDLDEGRTDKAGKTVLTRRVFARPGALTDRLRRAWGLQPFKKDEKLKRVADDRHHALDALIVAAMTESLLNRATREVQEIEKKGLHYDLAKNIAPPWPEFREQALATLAEVFVARAPRPRARGKAHDATIRQIGERDGQEIVFERKRVADLKLADLDRVKDKDRNAAMVASLRSWIADGSPKDKPPLSPKKDPIAKVRLESKGKVAIRLYRGGPEHPAGAVDRGEMARVDVFSKRTPKGVLQYFLVPIYPHEIATLDCPPNRAVAAGKPESEWPVMDESYDFLWSLVPMTLLRVIDKNGTVLFSKPGEEGAWAQADGNLGYFRGLDRTTGAISLSSITNSSWVKTGIGARTLHSFQKLTLDRLGHTFEVRQEVRTWHGKACI
ncbi:type II CRISPR RNA-guided endonuclease Cas9 [Xanthobacter autotrophicus]|uniref:type II CRISPR RNA-guided endonuclease Cas9 n=1 Tax=Xanthobacter autotrophicus TaxID=280 RepID=UPI0037279836